MKFGECSGKLWGDMKDSERRPIRVRISAGNEIVLHPSRDMVLARPRRGISRRHLIVGAGGVAITAVIGKALVDAIDDFSELAQKPETQEQKDAKLLFNYASDGDKIRNAIVVGEKVGDKFIVTLRNRPATPDDKLPGDAAGEEVGELIRDTVIPEAIVVWGNNRDLPADRSLRQRWLAFRDPRKDSGRFVFAYAPLFEEARITKVNPYSVWSGEGQSKK